MAVSTVANQSPTEIVREAGLLLSNQLQFLKSGIPDHSAKFKGGGSGRTVTLARPTKVRVSTGTWNVSSVPNASREVGVPLAMSSTPITVPWIFTDDQRYMDFQDMKQQVITPSIKRLAAEIERNVLENVMPGIPTFAQAATLCTYDERLDLALWLERQALDVDDDDLPRADVVEQDLLRELILDLALDRPTQRTRTQHRIKATLGEQLLSLVGQLQIDVLGLQLLLDAADHQVDHLDDLLGRQLVEHDDVIDAVEELRTEVLLQLVVDLLLHPLVVVVTAAGGEAQADRLGDVGGTQVRGEDQHGVLEVDRAALAVGQPGLSD